MKFCKEHNAETLCRTCMQSLIGYTHRKHNIFETPDLAKKLMLCTFLTMEVDDNHPKYICDYCFQKVNNFFEFRIMCEQSMECFDEILKYRKLHGLDCELIFQLEDPSRISDVQAEVEGASNNSPIAPELNISDDQESVDSIILTEPENERSLHSPQYNSDERKYHLEGNEKHTDEVRGNDKDCSELSAEEERLHMTHNINENHNIFIEEKGPDILSNLNKSPTNKPQGCMPFTCLTSGCEQVFENFIELCTHLKTHEKTKKYYCKRGGCEREFTKRTGFLTHMRNKHKIDSSMKTMVCEICGMAYASKSGLQYHYYSHKDRSELPHSCDYPQCQKRYATRTQLNTHLKRHAGIKEYVCKYCGLRKTTRTELNNHYSNHLSKRQHPCSFCCLVFNSAGNLKQHVRAVHECAKDHVCRFCGKAFVQMGALRLHERIHTGDKPYECKECHKKFSQSSQLRTHERMHSGEKPYECKKCNKKFRERSLLRTHERPYECKECHKRFGQRSLLRTHEWIHTGNKRYACVKCDKSYTQSHMLRIHEMTHTGERPFECKVCGKCFTYPSSLVKHKRTQHQDDNKNNKALLAQT